MTAQLLPLSGSDGPRPSLIMKSCVVSLSSDCHMP